MSAKHFTFSSKLSAALFIVSFALLALGIWTTVTYSPCSQAGVLITIAASSLIVVACIALLVRTLKVTTKKAWGLFTIGLIVSIVGVYFSYLTTLLLCTGCC